MDEDIRQNFKNRDSALKKKLSIFAIIITAFTVWYFFVYKPRIQRTRPLEYTEIISGGGHILWGYPTGPDVMIFEYEGFVSGYDTLKLNPRWVSYNLKKEYIFGKKYMNSRRFIPEPSLQRHQSAQNRDFTRSGYDRGHIARQSNMRGRSLLCEQQACYFTNVSPQTPHFNRVVWSNIENLAINLTKTYGESWIIAGPYFQDRVLLLNDRVRIPCGFYKIVVLKTDEGHLPLAFVLDHDAESMNPEDYMVTIDSVQTLTGIDFFHELEDKIEAVFESKLVPLPYGWR